MTRESAGMLECHQFVSNPRFDLGWMFREQLSFPLLLALMTPAVSEGWRGEEAGRETAAVILQVPR